MDPSFLLNPFVFLYVLSAVLIYVALVYWRTRQASALQAARANQGLRGPILLGSEVKLIRFKRAAAIEAAVMISAVLILPFVWWLIAWGIGGDKIRDGLALAFAAVFLWVLLTATDVGRAFFGGLAFRLYAAFHPPFQVGDRVTLMGFGGKVLEIGLFHVRLQTLDDDLVSIPTAGLWGQPLTSANAGDRASMCVIPVYLAPFAGADSVQIAEDKLWASMHASIYLDPIKPRQIYVELLPDAIKLTAKAYVASTYNEPLFKSDVTKEFLKHVTQQDLPLASPAWRQASTNEQK